MNIELTEDQNELLKELKFLDPQVPFKGIPDIAPQIEEQEIRVKPKMDMFFDVDYDR